MSLFRKVLRKLTSWEKKERKKHKRAMIFGINLIKFEIKKLSGVMGKLTKYFQLKNTYLFIFKCWMMRFVKNHIFFNLLLTVII